MRALEFFAVGHAALLALACGPALPKPQDAGLGSPKGDTVEAQAEAQGLAHDEHLLFRPRGNPGELVGRAVSRTPGGGLTIADELRPGCKVDVRSTPEAWSRTYEDDLKRVAGGGIEVDEIAKLKVEYGEEAHVAVTIKNEARLDADLQGDCGDWLVASVRVGTGSRRIDRHAYQRGSGNVGVLSVGTQAGASQDQANATSFSWETPQAWMFTVAGPKHRGRLELNAAMPTELENGQTYRITVAPNRPVWLLVYYREADGQVGKLLPNEDNPSVAVARNERRELPELRATLRDPAQPAQEDMILCGFDHAEYVGDLAPPRGEPSAVQMHEWYEGLPERLNKISRRHYSCQEIAYRIVPVGGQDRGP